MKILIPLLLASLVIPFFAFSQNRTGASSGGLVGAGVGATIGVGHGSSSHELEKNITIGLTGKDVDGSPVDVAVTGCGPVFRADITVGEVDAGAGNKIPVMGTLEYVVRMDGENYLVDYTIGFTRPVTTSRTVSAPGGKGGKVVPMATTSVSFDDNLLNGTVRCVPGKGVEVFRSGAESTLVLQVTE